MELNKLFEGVDVVVHNTCSAIKEYEEAKAELIDTLSQRLDYLENIAQEHALLIDLFVNHLERVWYGQRR